MSGAGVSADDLVPVGVLVFVLVVVLAADHWWFKKGRK